MTRRHKNVSSVRKRATRLRQFCQGWLEGVDSNIRHKREAAARAQVDAVRVALDDLPGLIEDAIMSGAPHANAEIQRLRAAMVHAMDDAERAARLPTTDVGDRRVFLGIASRLKAALEKK